MQGSERFGSNISNIRVSSAETEMIRFIEERGEGVRLALGVVGFPTREDTERFAAWLEGFVEWRETSSRRPTCFFRQDGRAVDMIPRFLAGRPREEAIAEEAGHALVGEGPAD